MPAPSDIIARVQAYRAEVERIEARAGLRFARIAAAIDRELLKLLRRTGQRVTPADFRRIDRRINDLLLAAEAGLRTAALEHVSEVLLLTLARQATVFSRRHAVIEIWRDRIESGQILGRRALREWSVKVSRTAVFGAVDRDKIIHGRWDHSIGIIKKRMIESIGKRETWRELAEKMESVGELIVDKNGEAVRLRGQMSPQAFGRGFARRELTDVSNRMTRQLAAEIGIERFANVGIPDDRQSEECYESSQVGPQTMEWWHTRSPHGPPPRHVLNCRCLLLGVPPQQVRRSWKQANPVLEKRRATA